jgi:hypothetical protein
VFAATMSEDLRRTAWILNRVVGPTTTYISGTAAFDGFFRAANGFRHIKAGADSPFRDGATTSTAGVV